MERLSPDKAASWSRTFPRILVLAIMCLSSVASVASMAALTATARGDSLPPRLPIGYAGVDYYAPTDYFTHCPDFTWLQADCYDNPSLADPVRSQLISDLQFVHGEGIASTMRLWVSLDQMMRWNPDSGFAGLDPQAQANLDDTLSLFHQYGIHVVLVLLSYASGGDLN